MTAVVTGRPASGSADKKFDPVVEALNAMSEAALATIQMSVKFVHFNTVTSVDTAKEAWDALKVMFEASDNTQLLRLMDELSSLKNRGCQNTGYWPYTGQNTDIIQNMSQNIRP